MEKRKLDTKRAMRMPWGTVLAVACVTIFVLLQFWGVSREPAGSEDKGPNGVWAVVSLVFLVYLYRGRPLARQWARAFAVFGALAFAFVAYALFELGVRTGLAMLIPMLSIVCMIAIFFGLGTRASRRFFDLYCEACPSYRVRARDLMFRRIQCKECKREWQYGQGGIDVSAFD